MTSRMAGVAWARNEPVIVFGDVKHTMTLKTLFTSDGPMRGQSDDSLAFPRYPT
jgi:hypothetical protein